MQPHRVIAAFVDRLGRQIMPPAEWTPLTQEMADRLVAAGCLQRPSESVPAPAGSLPVRVDDAAPISTNVAPSEDDHVSDEIVAKQSTDRAESITEKVISALSEPLGGKHGRGRRGSKRRGK